MNLLHLRHVESLSREERRPFRHPVRWIGEALSLLHRAIVSAKFHHATSELYRDDYGDLFPPEQDASKFPQRPLALGDKWAF